MNYITMQENYPIASIDGYENVPANNEDALLKAVANQPVSVAIDAGSSDFQFYSEVTFMCVLNFYFSLPLSFDFNRTW